MSGILTSKQTVSCEQVDRANISFRTQRENPTEGEGVVVTDMCSQTWYFNACYRSAWHAVGLIIVFVISAHWRRARGDYFLNNHGMELWYEKYLRSIQTMRLEKVFPIDGRYPVTQTSLQTGTRLMATIEWEFILPPEPANNDSKEQRSGAIENFAMIERLPQKWKQTIFWQLFDRPDGGNSRISWPPRWTDQEGRWTLFSRVAPIHYRERPNVLIVQPMSGTQPGTHVTSTTLARAGSDDRVLMRAGLRKKVRREETFLFCVVWLGRGRNQIVALFWVKTLVKLGRQKKEEGKKIENGKNELEKE